MIDAVFLWFFSWPHWAEYLLAGWVSYGFSVFMRDVTQANWKATLITCLTLWPIALALQLLVGLHTLAVKVFDPDRGPLAALLASFKRASTSRHKLSALVQSGAVSINEVRAAKPPKTGVAP